jgi:hypothetical protein
MFRYKAGADLGIFQRRSSMPLSGSTIGFRRGMVPVAYLEHPPLFRPKFTVLGIYIIVVKLGPKIPEFFAIFEGWWLVSHLCSTTPLSKFLDSPLGLLLVFKGRVHFKNSFIYIVLCSNEKGGFRPLHYTLLFRRMSWKSWIQSLS